ncbi:MAG TPA: SRPBCC domain-containing protein [Steroidobacteraceae bacterium]
MRERTRGYAHRVDIDADAEQVWRGLTAAQDLVRWCSPGAQIRPQPGGLFRATVDRVTELDAHIDVFERARRMRLIYLPSKMRPPADTAIVDDFILDAAPHGTILRLLGSGVPATADWDTHFRRMQTGWRAAMTRLKVLVEKQTQRDDS